jgi:hypothetical protein
MNFRILLALAVLAGPTLVARAAPDQPIGGLVASYPLLAGNNDAYGLTYDDRTTPRRLLVSDRYDNRIRTYEIGAAGLTYVAGANIETDALHPEFLGPRGIAIGRDGARTYLYVLTSNAPGPAGLAYDSRLWRIDLDDIRPETTDQVNLNQSGLWTRGRKVYDVAYFGGLLYLSYDASDIAVPFRYDHGILRLKVTEGASPANYWTRLKRVLYGDNTAVDALLPDSGRAPAYGLAIMTVGFRMYLWATSEDGYIYLAEAISGRGVFAFASPGQRAARGLAYGGGSLWVVDQVAGTDVVHKVNVTSGYGVPLQGKRCVRHLQVRLKSTARRQVADMNVDHNFAEVFANALRPNQDVDAGSQLLYAVNCRDATYSRLWYHPASDWSCPQYYRQATYRGLAPAGTLLDTAYEADFWTSSRRHFVYPERGDDSEPPDGYYTADDSRIYGITADPDAFSQFAGEADRRMEIEYGIAGQYTDRFWRVRNLLEYLVEHYTYGNVSDSDSGHYAYNPARCKLRLPFDGVASNEKMSCSSSAFALVGMCRSLGIPARWIGTTKQRGEWDTNGDGLMTGSEKAVDWPFHRWVEVWLGGEYGWQRFDPTPADDGPRWFSQWELMGRSACGVGSSDLVLTVGSGYHFQFYEQSSSCQLYNSCPRYNVPDSTSNWDSTWRIAAVEDEVSREANWSNACFVQVTQPFTAAVLNVRLAPSYTVRWTTSGRWDMDPTATVSILAEDEAGARTSLRLGLPYGDGSAAVTVNGLADGRYRIYVVKDGDALTGGRSGLFTITRQ